MSYIKEWLTVNWISGLSEGVFGLVEVSVDRCWWHPSWTSKIVLIYMF